MATMYYRPFTSEPIKDDEPPSFDAMGSNLPEYQYIFNDPQAPKPDSAARARTELHRLPTLEPSPHNRNRDGPDLDQTAMSVMDQQMREIDNYRQAVTRMGQDILSLRNTVRELESTNSKLRLQLSNYQDATRIIVDSVEMDGLPKAEIASRYAALKQKITSQTSEMKFYKDKVQKLQNDLIKKNDKEKEYLKISHAHASQQQLLQKLQEKVNKVRRLEDTCRKQEKVIEKMELILEKQRGKSKSSKDANIEANAALIEENKRLRQQMEEIRQEQQTKTGKSASEDAEKLELYQALERAEGRIISLEKQMAENSRQWGRERAGLELRINEREHGLGQFGGLQLQDIPHEESGYKPSRLTGLSKFSYLRP